MGKVVRVLLLFSFVLSVNFAAQAAPFREEDGAYFATCKFDGHPQTCFIDTGASTAQIKNVEPFQSYPSLRRREAVGVSGNPVVGDLIQLRTIELHGYVQRDPLAMRFVGPLGSAVLGLDFFQRLGTVTFDFMRAEIRQEADRTRLCPESFTVEDRLLRVPARFSDIPTAAAWDTGSSVSVVSTMLLRQHPSMFTFVRSLTDGMDSTGSPARADLYTAEKISICGRDLLNVDLVAVDLSAAKSSMRSFPDVIIGANLMRGRVWSFDFSSHAWSFD
jgi:hypothetical protein